MTTHGAAVNCCGERGFFVLVLPGHPVDLAETALLGADDQTSHKLIGGLLEPARQSLEMGTLVW